MPRDLTTAPIEARAETLSAELEGLSAEAVLARVLGDAEVGRTALVSSFGAESVALLHLVSLVDRTTPVLFLDTEMLFPETLAFQAEVAGALGLTDVRRIGPLGAAERDPDGMLHGRDPDACCALRKTEPLERALAPFEAWITGRKRHQSAGRAALPLVEAAGGRLKVNPLAAWAPGDARAHMEAHDLPRHPLVARGYPSIGCAPCTSRVDAGEDERAGRWRGQDKDECGIHFVDGRIVRGPLERKAA